ncbi:MAG: hypothetical protein MZW92_34420 [Comamonadaceae bacterium]|nr:hypothetical protein [Comamonadaceae bacterium]
MPLFKRSIDTRHVDRYSSEEPARVNFGEGWARRGALELFTEVGARLSGAAAGLFRRFHLQLRLARGIAPGLAELRLHQGTVWLRNEADLRQRRRRPPAHRDARPAGRTHGGGYGGQCRLAGWSGGGSAAANEKRAIAGAAICHGGVQFYRAAQHGLGAKLVWPGVGRPAQRERAVTDILASLLPLAGEGLAAIGVSAAESARYLGVIERRLQRRQTGATWQRGMLAQLQGKMPLPDALHQTAGHLYES